MWAVETGTLADPPKFFAFAQSITISLAASNGLGKRLNSLDPLQLSSLLKVSRDAFVDRLQADWPKAQYAATFLFLASVCFAKLSLVAYLRNLTPLALYRKVSLLIGLVVALWATTAILSAAFQCRLPRPWDYINNTCFSRVSPALGLDVGYF